MEPTTGRFKTREALEKYVNRVYPKRVSTLRELADDCQVSQATLSRLGIDNPRRRGRPQTKGRFKTREALETYVRKHADRSYRDLAEDCKVSTHTVWAILTR